MEKDTEGEREVTYFLIIFLVLFSLLFVLLNLGSSLGLVKLSGIEFGSMVLAIMFLGTTPYSWLVYKRSGIAPRLITMLYFLFGNLVVIFLILSYPIFSSVAAFLFM